MNEETKKLLLGFFSKYPLKKYKKGEVILSPGQAFGGILFAKSGYIKVCTTAKDGKETCIPLFKPAFYLSLVSHYTNTKNRHLLEAITHTDLYVAPAEDFVMFLKENSQLSKEVMSGFLKKFLDLTTDMLQIIAGDAQTKILSLIYSLAGEFGVKNGEKVIIKFNITHKLLASLTGLTRETVTLQMLKLEKMGLIDNDKRKIVLTNPKKVAKMLEN